MAKMEVFNQEAKSVKTVEISDAVFSIEPNQQVMFDAVLAYQAGLRQGTHSTLTRSFVSGTGKKPFRQKGTGRARQGSTRAIQWRHGAKTNRKVRRLALRSALSEKVLESNFVLIENLNFEEMKTKKAVALLKAFGFDRKTLFVVDASEDFVNAYISMRNLPNALVTTVFDLNVYDLVNANKVVFTEKAAEKAGEVFA